jgi:hypothetical protein
VKEKVFNHIFESLKVADGTKDEKIEIKKQK